MKKLFTKAITLLAAVAAWGVASAQAPANAPDVMLQAFYWDSYKDGGYGITTWSSLNNQVDEIAEYFSLVWLPPSAAQEGGSGTGYHPTQFSNQNSSWGSSGALKTLISNLKSRDSRAIADIVINHHAGTGWVTFYAEEFGPNDSDKFQLTSAHICRDDEASENGYSPSGNNDAGYETLTCDGATASGGYCAARDLDHSSSYVQNLVKAYLKWMKSEMGYDGWRYDLVKGYLGKYTNQYNSAGDAYMSVGEFFDYDYDDVVYWINETNRSSMAFDFPGKSSINKYAGNNIDELVNGYGTWTGVSGAEEYCRYAVTFVENHDTYRDGNKYNGDWTRANAFILAGPGIPCVFWPHWVQCKDDIKKMIKARKACGIHSQSKAQVTKKGSYIEGTTVGTNGTLKMYIGSNWSAPSGYTLACSGDGWAYYTNVTVPQGPSLTMSPTSGYVGQGGKVTLTATGGTGTVSIYYTTNGSTPSASSTRYSSPISITSNNTQVRAIAIDASGNQSSVVSGTFLTERPSGYTIKVLSKPSSWSNVYIYAFANAAAIGREWPGDQMTLGSDGYYSYTVATEASSIGLVFSNGSDGGTNQTVDITGVTGDACYNVNNTTTGNEGKLSASAVTCLVSAVEDTQAVKVGVYPNPTTGVVYITAEKEISGVNVINLSGGKELESNESTVNITNLPPSLYFLEVTFTDGTKAVSKVVKK